MMALTVALAVLVGVALGLLGGGGAILTVPLLAYVGGLDATQAIATSLLVIAVTSAVGAIAHVRAGRVRWGVALPFGESDTLAVPTHADVRLANASGKAPAFLFMVDDAPLHRKLGFYEVFD